VRHDHDEEFHVIESEEGIGLLLILAVILLLIAIIGFAYFVVNS
jgi:hypothetical protein